METDRQGNVVTKEKVEPNEGQSSGPKRPRSIFWVALSVEHDSLPERLEEVFAVLDAGEPVGVRGVEGRVTRVKAETVYLLYQGRPHLRNRVLARYPDAEKLRLADEKQCKKDLQEELHELKTTQPKQVKTTPVRKKKAQLEPGKKSSQDEKKPGLGSQNEMYATLEYIPDPDHPDEDGEAGH